MRIFLKLNKALQVECVDISHLAKCLITKTMDNLNFQQN